MRSYAEREVFTAQELERFRVVQEVVSIFEVVGEVADLLQGAELRCHEVARAAGWLSELPYVDGHVGYAQHSWLWTRQPSPEELGMAGKQSWMHEGRPRIIDPYTPGREPMVQLIDTHPGIHTRVVYTPDPAVGKVVNPNLDIVRALINQVYKVKSRIPLPPGGLIQ